MMKKNYRKGFTLIEMLIIIAVIGVLATAFIYSSTEAVATARATVILNNLHMIKDAVLQFYADNPDLFEYGNMNYGIQNYLHNKPERIALITKYFDRQDIEFQTDRAAGKGGYAKMPCETEGSYGVADAGKEGNQENIGEMNPRFTWFVGYRFKTGEERVKEKLAARAKSAGLIFAGHIPNIQEAADQNVNGEIINVSKGEDVVWLRVFGSWTDEERFK